MRAILVSVSAPSLQLEDKTVCEHCLERTDEELIADLVGLKTKLDERESDEVDVDCYWCIYGELRRRGATKIQGHRCCDWCGRLPDGSLIRVPMTNEPGSKLVVCHDLVCPTCYLMTFGRFYHYGHPVRCPLGHNLPETGHRGWNICPTCLEASKPDPSVSTIELNI